MSSIADFAYRWTTTMHSSDIDDSAPQIHNPPAKPCSPLYLSLTKVTLTIHCVLVNNFQFFSPLFKQGE